MVARTDILALRSSRSIKKGTKPPHVKVRNAGAKLADVSQDH